jgi:hypothetical protein
MSDSYKNPDRPAQIEDMEITPEMVDGVVEVFWDFFGDRMAVTYDARPFALEVVRRMESLQARRKGE